ncbi:expressed unknown protein [Seminavis robusta]|uniref:Uncharacterized protein n=1 Tax=Seminavis robusta TaxID=568900 RepID=A0A9N8H7R2_9STRA|nr:expressed unknown protein [Seminavis robusta]|eukprot:Sro190_g081690.1 n/a (450) ;mRNA; r:8791-10268
MNHWRDLLKRGSLADLGEQLDPATSTVPSTLLHWACQEPLTATTNAKIQFLVQKLPDQLTIRDENHKIPLHHVCQQNSSMTFSVLRLLLEAAPESILMRLHDEDDDDEGILPSFLAHHHGAPGVVVQYLLRRQFAAHKGLIVTHQDLSCLLWNEASFWQHVAIVMFQVEPEMIEQIRLVLCQEEDEAFWQRMVQVHKSTLVKLEMPQFYALTTSSVQCMAQILANRDFPDLQVLDARCFHTLVPTPTQHPNKNPQLTVTETLARGLRDPSCRLKSLSLGTLTASELKLLLLQGLRSNRSVEYFQVERINMEEFGNNKKLMRGWMSLREILCLSLQQNTSLERVVGPRPLTQCAQVQLYLQLNREFHRRDMGAWSPTLVALVLAKAKLEMLAKSGSSNNDGYHFAAAPEPPGDPRSAMFYILQSRPDILRAGTATSSASNVMFAGGTSKQ